MNSQPQSQLTDFPDWLSPLLVKDLRRVLRGRTFSLTLVALLAAMSLVFISLILSEANTDFLQGMWIPISVVFLILQPARGLNAIVEERKLGTLPLMQVTGMSSFRILLGKWSSLSAQTLLFTTALVPYLVLGHFLGGFEFFSQLLNLLTVVLFSLVFTAVTVSLSAIKSTLARVIVTILLFIFGSQLLGVPVALAAIFTISSQWALQSVVLICALFGSVFLIHFVLSLGASRLSIPGTENYSTMRRFFALILTLLLVGLMCWNGLSSSRMMSRDELITTGILAAIFWGMMALDGLTDPFALNEKVLTQMKRWPRPLAWLLTPGWPFGWLLSLLSFLLILGALSLQTAWWEPTANLLLAAEALKDLLRALSIFSLVALPAWVALRVEQNRGSLVGMYFMIQLIALLIGGFLSGMTSSLNWKALTIITPFSNLFYLSSESYQWPWALLSSAGFFLLTCGLFFWSAFPAYRQFRKQFKEAKADSNNSPSERPPSSPSSPSSALSSSPSSQA